MVHYNRLNRAGYFKDAAAKKPDGPIPVFQKTVEPPPKAESKAEAKASAETAESITYDMVLSAVIVGMQTAATFVDESFNALQSVTLPDGTQTFKPLPHIEEATKQMMPWVKIYGAALVKAMPWIGLAHGVALLAAPAYGPITEIIAGVRKPRIFRQTADDIYTEAFKSAQAKRAAKAAAQQEPAAQREIEINPPPGSGAA